MGGAKTRHRFELVAGQVERDIELGIRQRSALYTIDTHSTRANRHHARPCGHGRHILHRPDPCNYATGKQGCTVHRQIRRDLDNLGGMNNDFLGKCAGPQPVANGDALLIGDRRGFVQRKTSLAQAFLVLPAKKAIAARAEQRNQHRRTAAQPFHIFTDSLNNPGRFMTKDSRKYAAPIAIQVSDITVTDCTCVEPYMNLTGSWQPKIYIFNKKGCTKCSTNRGSHFAAFQLC